MKVIKVYLFLTRSDRYQASWLEAIASKVDQTGNNNLRR